MSWHKMTLKVIDVLAHSGNRCLGTYQIGSGVVESARSHVVKDRMEKSGARWEINESESILKLRSVAKSKGWDEYWEFFTAQAQNNIFFPDEYNFMNVQEKMAA